jgi:acetolactate synthase I/II/III large subunit
MEKYEVSVAFAEVSNANGVEDIFLNPGGEMAHTQATIAGMRVSGKKAPRLVLCLDESVAMTGAHGHYMISGRPQVVMVHCELGSLQIGGALHNAQWGRIPVIIWAGEMAGPERVNWKNEPFDQGLMARNCVKWDHMIRPGENVRDVLQKAFEIAYSEPRGPVYLSYPREMLTEKIDKVVLPELEKSPVQPIPSAEAAALEKAAQALIDAENPLIVAGYTGRYAESVASLVELAETLCAPVLPSQVWMNFPTTHPLCAGIEQILGSRRGNPHIADADVVLVIDYDVPYAIAEGVPSNDAKVVHIDIDPLTQGRPLWGHGADTFIKADSRAAIPALIRLVQQKLTAERTKVLRERFGRLENGHKKMRSEWKALAMSNSGRKPISPDWLSHCVSEVIDNDTIVVNHTITDSASVTEQINRTEPGTLLGCAAGSIQWAPAAAFGAKIAAPDKTVVSLMTDGGFVWGCPVATLWSARRYGAAFLSVIFNNRSYRIIRQLVGWTSGQEKVSDKLAFEAGTDIIPPPDYAAIAQGCDCYGRTVEEPADVIPALKEAMELVRRGKPAVVNVILESE